MAGIGSAKVIKIVQMQVTHDAHGFSKPGEILLWAGWAQVSNASGYRDYQNGQALLGHTKEFKIRHHQAITSDVNTRLIYSGKRYTVTSIEEDREKQFYWIIRGTAETKN